MNRECATCGMCCKVFEIKEFNKLAGTWCHNFVAGKGCNVYVDRPQLCKDFVCQWLIDNTLGPEWKPDTAKFVLRFGSGGHLVLGLDPGAIMTWKSKLYLPRLRMWAAQLAELDRLVVAVGGSRNKTTVILPDRDVEIGELPEGMSIGLIKFFEGSRLRYEVDIR